MGQADLFTARKTCLGCEKELPETEFTPHKGNGPGKRLPRCRACVAAYYRDWNKRHPGYAAQKHKEWFARNGAAWNERQRQRTGAIPRAEMLESQRRKLLSDIGERATPGDQVDLPKIYFIQEGTEGPIKIGWTARMLRHRMHQLQIGNPRPLYVLGIMGGDASMEADLHAAFAHLSITGSGEWFRADEELLTFIAAVAVVPDMVQRPPRTGYRGVSLVKGGKYIARIKMKALTANLGTYDTAEEAARVYDAKRRELGGRKMRLNFPDEGEHHWQARVVGNRRSDVG